MSFPKKGKSFPGNGMNGGGSQSSETRFATEIAAALKRSLGAFNVTMLGVGAAIGAGIGLLLGYMVGNEMDKYDKEQINKTLESQPSGKPMTWKNPDSGNYGDVTPVRSYNSQQGQYCREFQQTIYVDGKREQGYGTACRQPDGSWQLVD